MPKRPPPLLTGLVAVFLARALGANDSQRRVTHQVLSAASKADPEATASGCVISGRAGRAVENGVIPPGCIDGVKLQPDTLCNIQCNAGYSTSGLQPACLDSGDLRSQAKSFHFGSVECKDQCASIDQRMMEETVTRIISHAAVKCQLSAEDSTCRITDCQDGFLATGSALLTCGHFGSFSFDGGDLKCEDAKTGAYERVMSGADLLRMTSTVKAAMKIIKANGSLGPKALALGTAQAAKQAKGHAEDIVNAAVLGATYAALQTSGQAARAAQEAALAAGANEGDARSRAADAAAAAMIVEALCGKDRKDDGDGGVDADTCRRRAIAAGFAGMAQAVDLPGLGGSTEVEMQQRVDSLRNSMAKQAKKAVVDLGANQAASVRAGTRATLAAELIVAGETRRKAAKLLEDAKADEGPKRGAFEAEKTKLKDMQVEAKSLKKRLDKLLQQWPVLEKAPDAAQAKIAKVKKQADRVKSERDRLKSESKQKMRELKRQTNEVVILSKQHALRDMQWKLAHTKLRAAERNDALLNVEAVKEALGDGASKALQAQKDAAERLSAAQKLEEGTANAIGPLREVQEDLEAMMPENAAADDVTRTSAEAAAKQTAEGVAANKKHQAEVKAAREELEKLGPPAAAAAAKQKAVEDEVETTKAAADALPELALEIETQVGAFATKLGMDSGLKS